MLKVQGRAMTHRSLLFAAFAAAPAVFAQTTPAITYIPNSSVKVYQVNGDCDWVQWDATISNKTPTCKPTVSQTLTKADILGDDVPVVFENNGEMIVTFGDTIGALNNAPWSEVNNSFNWGAKDPIARSTTLNASDGLLLNFFLSGAHGLQILPPPQPNGSPVDMAIDNIPHAGIAINGTIYLGIKTGNIPQGDGNNDQSQAYSLLATFNETTQAFTSGRTVSTSPNGHFVGGSFYQAAAGMLGSPPPVTPEPTVLNFGVGIEHASNIYLSIIPSAEFFTGVDGSGNSATRYYSGMSNGQPTWSNSETSAVPIVLDADPANPTINKVSAFYSQQLGLWLLMFDSDNSPGTRGMYFTYAAKPWGPWSTPQMLFNDCRDKGLGSFMFYYYATAADNNCAGLANATGPSGPTIGSANDPATTRGHAYAPALVERFTTISGSTLKLYYLMATWNPYATVLMESDFTLAYGPTISAVSNAASGAPSIAPNTWVGIDGIKLAPDTRTWQSPDFVNGKLPTALDAVSVTVNGKPAFVYYISPTQVNVLTPPDAMSGSAPVVVTVNGTVSTAFNAQAQSASPSFFLLNGGPNVAAVHADGSLIGPAALYPGASTPAKPGETVLIYGNGFGPTVPAVVSGSAAQSGSLAPLPMFTIGGVPATVQFAGLVYPGEFHFNVVIPSSLGNGAQPILATYNGLSTQASASIAVHN
jgi:uncharacterized protein (TIGR03437 family)